MSLIPNQEYELMKIYELTILRKLRLSKNFPRQILHTRKSTLGIGIMKLLTIVDTLALKLHIGHKRQSSRISTLIQANKEEALIQYRCLDHPMHIKQSTRY